MTAVTRPAEVPDRPAIASAATGAGDGNAAPALLTITLFLVAAVASGAIALAAFRPPGAALPGSLPGLPPVSAEPAAAAALVGAIAGGDAATVADALSTDQLLTLEAWLDPLVEITRTEYLGGIEKDGEAIVAYALEGTAADGFRGVVGLTLRIRDGKVVGIQ